MEPVSFAGIGCQRLGPVARGQGGVDFPAAALEGSLPSRFSVQVEHGGGNPAVSDHSGCWTYRELAVRSRDISARLAARLPSRQPVALLIGFERIGVAAIFGILGAGHWYVPLDPRSPVEHLRRQLEDCEARVVLTSHRTANLARAIASAGQTVLVLEGDPRTDGEGSGPAHVPATLSPGPEDLAYVIYTSGSSGRPKGVMQTHRNILFDARRQGLDLAITPEDRFGLIAPFSFSVSVCHVFGALLHGASVHLFDPLERGLPELIRWLNVAAISVLDINVSTYRALIEILEAFRLAGDETRHFRAMRVVSPGSEPVQQRDFEAFRRHFPPGCAMQNALGSTETRTVTQIYLRHGDRVEGPDVPIGWPIDGKQVLLIDEYGRESPRGPGQIVVRSRFISPGYWRDDALTDRTFRPDREDPDLRLYVTGDIGERLADGRLRHLGRLDSQVKIRGARVEIAEVEMAIASAEGVKDVAVLPWDLPEQPTQLVAFVTVTDPAGLPMERLRRDAANRLPGAMVPHLWVVLPRLPVNANGKLDRLALQRQVGELMAAPSPCGEAGVGEGMDPHACSEKQLEGLFRHVLGPRRREDAVIGPDSDFFAMGGDSLGALRLMAQLAAAGWGEHPPSLLFATRTPAQLAARLRGGSGWSSMPSPPPMAAGPATIPRLPPRDGGGGPAWVASFAQARLWFLHQLEPRLTSYHLPALWRLRGDLDPQALGSALASLIVRHPTLRTAFRGDPENGVPLQILHPPAAFPLEAERLEDRDPEAVVAAWLQAEHTQPFDLAAGLLLRARLLQRAPDDHVLLLNHHHIASDGWSRDLLNADLSELYNAHRNGRAPRLPALNVQYHDFATWQRERLSGRLREELLAYWLPQLRGLEPLDLPTDHSRPPFPSQRGGSIPFSIAAPLLSRFESFCRSEGATLQMGLLALVAVLLHRYSRQTDFAIGIPIWGRNHPDLEPLVGCFINTLPIRLRLNPPLSFRELLQHVRSTSLAAYDHQELPFEQMVEALPGERETSRHPLVQVVLQFVEQPDPSRLSLEGLVVEALPTGPETARFELEFLLRRSGDGLQGSLTYAADLFGEDRIQRLTSHLQTLLASVLEAPDAPSGSLNLLPDGERLLIERWQRGPAGEGPNLCIHQRFAQLAARDPDAAAVVFQEQRLSYGELNRRANQLAHALIDRGIGPESIIALCLERSAELIVAMLAILKAGGAYLYVPPDPTWPEARRRLLVREARPIALLTISGLDGWLEPNPGLVCLRLDDPALNLELQGWQDPGSGHHTVRQLATLTFTSGSTGLPKGVLIEHRSILRLLDPSNPYAIRRTDRVLQLAHLSFDAANLEIWGSLLSGATLVVAPPGRLGLDALATLLREQRISTLWLTAGLFHAMVEQCPEALTGVRQLLSGGDVLAAGPVQKLLDGMPPGHLLINGYGPTESATFTCCHAMAAGTALPTQEVSIGRPITATWVRVLDGHGNPCPIGIPGELHIGGAGLARGYLNNPELTAERFIADPAPAAATSTGDSVRLYRSGDLVAWNSDGSLAFHGRLDRQIKLRGFRIEPGEIEAHLLAHPAVAQAAVELWSDASTSPRLIAYWVPRSAAAGADRVTAPAEALRSFLADRLPDFQLPASFVALDALPLTSSGKLDRLHLPAPSLSADPQQRVPPSTPLQGELHALWSEVLGHGDFGITDDFFRVGGHSLAAARLISRIEQTLGSAPPLAAIFHAPTIADLAGLMEETTPDARPIDPCLVPLQPRGEATPLFVIHGYGGDVFGYTAFARALGPGRPVFGLQAMGLDGSAPRHRSVEEMAEHYATLILQRWPGGPYHLLGQSAGGWYAFAVAAALLRRGGTIGLLSILDSGPTALLRKRVRASLLLHRLGRRLSGGLRRLPWRQPRGLVPHLGRRLRGLMREAIDAPGQPSEDYCARVHESYRPPVLPVAVDLFTTPDDAELKRRLWQAHARGGVRHRLLFKQHYEYHHAECGPALAAAVSRALLEAEACR